jgi:hypothetical protein
MDHQFFLIQLIDEQNKYTFLYEIQFSFTSIFSGVTSGKFGA